MPTLLVIDDEPNVLYSLENALRSDTLSVLTAPTAKQGITLAREKKPDAVLLDGEAEIYHKVQFAVDRAVLDEVLRYVKGNQVEAARRLGISRTTLRVKLQALDKLTGLSPPPDAELSDP